MEHEEAASAERVVISVTDSGGVTSSPVKDADADGSRQQDAAPSGTALLKPDDAIVPAQSEAGTDDSGQLSTSRRPSFYQLEGRSRSRSVGERQWTRVRAVMTWYTRLRRIKKTPMSGDAPCVSPSSAASSSTAATAAASAAGTGRPHDPSSLPDGRSRSTQRWMKLRTTVQLTGAISNTVAIAQSKKTSLKREDSFIARFSTRQIAEAQETFDATDEGGSSSGGAYGAGAAPVNGDGNKSGPGGQGAPGGAGPCVKRRRRQKPPRSVLNPDENGLFYWLAFLALWVLYNLWTVVVRLAFPELHSGDSLSGWNVCDALGDAAYVLDIAVQFRTGYLEQGIMVHDSRKLAKHYVHSRAFLIDMASLVPFDWFLLPTQVSSNNAVLARWRPALRFFRLAKLYRVCTFYYVVESRTVYPNAWRVVNLVHILLMLAHWFGCFYFLLSEWEGFQSDWSYPYPDGDFATLTRKYLGSLYWSTLTLTTIGDLPTPETNAEYIFTIASYLIGVFIFATIVGQVGNVITNRNASRLEFERLLDTAKLYMRHHKVPRSMQRRVQRWYDYSWSRGRIQGGGDTSSALRILPDKLKTELALHVNLATLKKVSIFKECQPEFLHDLVLKMRASIFTPGDMICRRGEVAREMFIIADGILEVISETGKVLTTMKAGDFFGEIGILNLDGLNKRTADVRSVGYAELFSLSREDVLAAMKDYPEAEEILLSLGRKRLIEARKATSQHKAAMARKGLLALERQAQLRAHQEEGDATPADAESCSGTQSAASKLTERLRSDVYGLKRAIRKSFKESRRPKSDSPTRIEMGTYGTGGTVGGTLSKAQSVPLRASNTMMTSSITSASSSKSHLLRRMAHVASEDMTHSGGSSEDCQVTQPLLPAKAESPVEVIGAGLPLFQRLKLLRQRELERERQQQLQQEKEEQQKQQQQQQQEHHQLQHQSSPEKPISGAHAAEAQPEQKEQQPLASAEIINEKSPPPPEKHVRHISFFEELPVKKDAKDYAPIDQHIKAKARWTLAALPGRSVSSRLAKTKWLDTIAGSGSSAVDPEEANEPPPPPPPPLPPTPPFWKQLQEKRSAQAEKSRPPSPPPMPPPPRPPLPHFSGLAMRRKKPPRRAFTLRTESIPESDVPYRPVGSIRSMIKPPWHRSTEATHTLAPPKFRSAAESGGGGGIFAPTTRRFSRQNTIQVVSDVQGVLTDILRDIIPHSKQAPVSKPLIDAPAEDVQLDYGTMNAPNWPSASIDELPRTPPRSKEPLAAASTSASAAVTVRPKRLNLRQCKNSSSRDYNSIDDLSPEYTVLPFVKRLKILNERQKIVELQRALTTTNPPTAAAASSVPSTVADESAAGGDQVASADALTPVAAKPDVNETPERITLKKLLKSASRKESLEPQDQTHRMKLLRSQTVEGYAVRHSNFTKLNYQRMKNNHRIVESPNGRQPDRAPDAPDHSIVLPDESGNPFKAFTSSRSAMPYLERTSPDGAKEECVSELLTAIKTVLQDRLDEIQTRFQAQINVLQCELDQKNELIAELQKQLEANSVGGGGHSSQHVTSPPVVIQSASQDDDGSSTSSGDDDDEFGGTLRYFARSRSRGSFIHMPSSDPSSLRQADDHHHQRNALLSIDDLLDTPAGDAPPGTVLNPEPLWQLEFGSCWQRMHADTAGASLASPRDVILDLGGSSDTETSATSSFVYSSPHQSRQQSKTDERSPNEPYVPDWEIQMLAESMDRDDELLDETQPSVSTIAERRGRLMRSSASVDPQTKSSFKSRQLIENWHWSYPPPNQEGGVDEEDEH